MNIRLAQKVVSFYYRSYFNSPEFKLLKDSVDDYPKLLKQYRTFARELAKKKEITEKEEERLEFLGYALLSENYLDPSRASDSFDLKKLDNHLNYKGSRKYIKEAFRKRKNSFIIATLITLRYIELNNLRLRLNSRETLTYLKLISAIKSYIFLNSLEILYPVHSTFKYFTDALHKINQDQFSKTLSSKNFYQKRYDLSDFKNIAKINLSFSAIERYAKHLWGKRNARK